MFIATFLAQTVIGLAQQLLLTSGALKTLRDLRIDLFASLERKPASFYDHVAVGRVMTRVTNDVENLFDLLTGFVGRAGIVIQFFVAAFIMLTLSGQLSRHRLGDDSRRRGSPPTTFAGSCAQVFRLIRDSVSSLNQYMQEDLIGIEVVQLSGREAMNQAQYGELNGAQSAVRIPCHQLRGRVRDLQHEPGHRGPRCACCGSAAGWWCRRRSASA